MKISIINKIFELRAPPGKDKNWMESRNLVGKMYFNVAFMAQGLLLLVVCCFRSVMCTFESAIRSYLYNGSSKLCGRGQGGTVIKTGREIR